VKKLWPLIILAVSLASQTAPVAAQNWTSTGSMPVTRRDHTATLLTNGKVLIVGGTNTGALLYDPATGLFSPTAGPPFYEPAQGSTATRLLDGRVLIVGGVGGQQLAQIYDPVSGTFGATTGPPAYVHSFHTATLLPDGRVLIAGGQDSTAGPKSTNLAELYSPATGTFTLTTGVLNVDRVDHSATLLPNGKVLIAEGTETTTAGNGILLSSTELFDPGSQTFTLGPNMSVARTSPMATLLPNGKVLISGWVYSAVAELYDPTTNTVATTGSMTTPHGAATATLLPSGQVLVAGGVMDTAAFYGTLNSAELYDPVAGTFTATASMSAARQEHTATLLPDGRVLVAGGFYFTTPGGAGADLSSAELYSSLQIYVSTFTGHQILRVDATTGGTNVLFTDATPDDLEGLAVGPDNLIYAAAPTNNRIIRIDQSGGSFATVYDLTTASPPAPTEPQGPSFGTTGLLTFNAENGDGVWQIGFNSTDSPGAPVPIIPAASGAVAGQATTFNLADAVLIVDQASSVVLQQTPPGASTTTALIGSANLSTPVGVAMNSSGNIFVSNLNNCPTCTFVNGGTIGQFTSAGAFVNTYAAFTAPDAPAYMQFDATGNLYVVTVEDGAGDHGKVWRLTPPVAPATTSTPLLLVDLDVLYNSGSNSIGLASGTARGLALPATSFTTQPQAVTPGVPVNFTYGNITNQMISLPSDAVLNGTASMKVNFQQWNPSVFDTTRITDPSTNTTTNTWSGGTPVPIGTTCTLIAGTGGNCVVIQDLCFDSTGAPIFPCDISTGPSGTLIGLTSKYQTQSPQPNPALIIADDRQNDWANITTGYSPNDPTISGGTKSLNTDTAIVNLNLTGSSDTVPPTTTATTSPLANAAGWNNSAVTVMLSSTDDTTVEDLTYSASGGETIPSTIVPGPLSLLSTSFEIANQGQTDVLYQAVDGAGNIEALKTLAIKIDTTAPNISITVPANGATYGARQAVAANYSCTDPVPAGVNLVSGLATCVGPVANSRPIDTSPAGTLTTKSFTVNAADGAGNSATSTVDYRVSCHYVSMGFNPSSVSPGSIDMVTGTLMSCMSTAQTVVITFTLKGPLQPNACGNAESLMFATPPLTLRPNTQQTVNFPFWVPGRICAGTYNVVATTKSLSGALLDTSSASLTVK